MLNYFLSFRSFIHNVTVQRSITFNSDITHEEKDSTNMGSKGKIPLIIKTIN